MFPTEWGLKSSPFRRVTGEAGLAMGATREEAFARLCFLIEEEHHCGLLHGPSGTGKSELLRVLGRQIHRSQRRLVRIDLYCANLEELSGQLAEGFGLARGQAQLSSWELWRGIRDELTVRAMAGIPTVLLVDHWDRANSESASAILRLIHLASGPDIRMTTVAASRTLRSPGDGGELAGACDLLVPLRPFGPQETGEYVETVLRDAGAVEGLMTLRAQRRIFERTGGVTRAINRLCDLALVAGTADHCAKIDADLIERVADEFCMPADTVWSREHVMA